MDLLLSKDLEEYLKEQNRTFTDTEVATLIFNSEKEISVIRENYVINKVRFSDQTCRLQTANNERQWFTGIFSDAGGGI